VGVPSPSVEGETGSVVARKTKVVCTIGPAVFSKERLFALADAGMNVARCV
jgi:pyruvate kinase